MRLFDSHCHLDDKIYQPDRETVLIRARKAGVQGFMVVGINVQTARKAILLAETHPDIFASVGIHPHDAAHCSEAVLEALIGLTEHAKVRAWGETGLDFNRMYSPREVQEKWFERQLDIAARLDLPLIFHERDSNGRFLEMLKASGRTSTARSGTLFQWQPSGNAGVSRFGAAYRHHGHRHHATAGYRLARSDPPDTG
jgi:TatD DNase family protein